MSGVQSLSTRAGGAVDLELLMTGPMVITNTTRIRGYRIVPERDPRASSTYRPTEADKARDLRDLKEWEEQFRAERAARGIPPEGVRVPFGARYYARHRMQGL